MPRPLLRWLIFNCPWRQEALRYGKTVNGPSLVWSLQAPGVSELVQGLGSQDETLRRPLLGRTDLLTHRQAQMPSVEHKSHELSPMEKDYLCPEFQLYQLHRPEALASLDRPRAGALSLSICVDHVPA
jgi:hypothetical protein